MQKLSAQDLDLGLVHRSLENSWPQVTSWFFSPSYPGAFRKCLFWGGLHEGKLRLTARMSLTLSAHWTRGVFIVVRLFYFKTDIFLQQKVFIAHRSHTCSMMSSKKVAYIRLVFDAEDFSLMSRQKVSFIIWFVLFVAEHNVHKQMHCKLPELQPLGVLCKQGWPGTKSQVTHPPPAPPTPTHIQKQLQSLHGILCFSIKISKFCQHH